MDRIHSPIKDTGMPIKDIKEYAKLRSMGEPTMKDRMDMLIKHKAFLKSKIDALNNHMKKLDDKIDYYASEINNNH